MRNHLSRCRTSMRTAGVLMLFLTGLARAQTATPQRPPAKPKDYQSQIQLEFKMTPEEAKQLLASVDAVLEFGSQTSGLPIRKRVEGELVNRDRVKEKVERNLQKDDAAARLERSSLVMKKFGLIPRHFDLKAFGLELLREQVGGFYDPETKKVYLLNWLPTRAQLPVLAHELTHALQDQAIGLESWLKMSANEEKVDPKDIERDEKQMARRAVAEGQAMAVMIDYGLASQNRSLADLPVLSGAALRSAIPLGSYPVMQRAPRYIRESMMFPYSYGLGFVHALLVKRGKERAFAGVLKHPPQHTRHVMEPAAYLAGETVAPVKLSGMEPILGGEFEHVDAGVFGEFDTLVFAQQFASEEQARRIASEWRGGVYYAARRKSPTKTATLAAANGEEQSQGNPGEQAAARTDVSNVSLLYLSRWASPAAAREFAGIYSASVPMRYPGAEGKTHSATEGASAQILAWETSEGSVVIETYGSLLLVTESFDHATAAKLRSAARAQKN